MKTLGRLLVVAAVIIFLLFLVNPGFISNAGNALLKSVGSSTVYGSAQVVPHTQGTGSDLQVNLQGLNSHGQYVVTLDEGQCGGTTVMTIGNASSDPNGAITSTFSLDKLNATIPKNLYVNVHQGSVSGPSVACGQVQINSTVASQANKTSNSGLQDVLSNSSSNVGGFPQTGVAPAKKNTYDNYKYPRKY